MARIHGKFRVTLAQVQNSNADPRRAWPDAGQLAVKHQDTITRNEDGQFSSPSLTAEYVRIYCDSNNLTH